MKTYFQNRGSQSIISTNFYYSPLLYLEIKILFNLENDPLGDIDGKNLSFGSKGSSENLDLENQP